MPTNLPLHFDSTMRSCFASCPQKFFLEFVQGYRPAGLSIDLHAGACFASALEDVYREVHLGKKNLDEALLVAQAGFFQRWGDIEIPIWKRTAKTSDRVWEAVEDYFRTYSPLTDHVQPYFAADGKPTFEYTFAIPLEPAVDPSKYNSDTIYAGVEKDEKVFPLHPDGGPFLYCGRFDMLGSHLGRPAVRDEKTTGSSIGDRWAEQWDLRGQFLGYVWACRECGLDVQDVIVRGIGIQKTQIRQIEAIKQYSDVLIDRWKEQLRRDLWRVRRCWDEGYWDYNFADACTSYGSCVFTRVCQSATPDSWLSEFEVRHWNPLLKNPTEEKPDGAGQEAK